MTGWRSDSSPTWRQLLPAKTTFFRLQNGAKTDFVIGRVNESLPGAPQPHVKRAVPAMRDMGIFHPKDEGPKFRK